MTLQVKPSSVLERTNPATVSVKICGLKDEALIEVALDAGADHIGFVHFAPSPRHVSLERMGQLCAYVADRAITWAVTASPDIALLQQLAETPGLHGVQVVGDYDAAAFETIRQSADPRIALMRGISVGDAADLKQADSAVDAGALLFDARPRLDDTLAGGNGVSFDWGLVARLQTAKPWMLAGGLNPSNVADAIAQSGARAVDVSSGIETSPGVKDAALIAQFVKAAKSI